MLKKKLFVLGIISFLSINSQAFAKTTSLEELQNLPTSNESLPVPDNAEIITKNHWAYKTLENISKKYNLSIASSNDKFNMEKPLSRTEAAVLLVSLMGQIKQNNVQLDSIEKDRVDILRQELSQEITELTGRVATLEGSVGTMKGQISKIESNDKKNIKVDFGDKFKIQGSLQTAYNGIISKGKSTDPLRTNFSIPIADLRFSGKPANHLDYLIQIAPYRTFDTNNAIMGDAFVSTDIIPKHTVYVGQTRIPFGIENTQSTLAIDSITRAQIARNGTGFGDTRDTGIKVAGKFPLFDYYAGVYSGGGQNAKDTNRSLDIVGWATVKPFYKHPEWGSLELGGGDWKGKSGTGWSYNTSGGVSTYTVPTVTNNTYGYYVGYKYKKFAIKSEYQERYGYKAISRLRAGGWYVMPTYFITPKLQLLAKYDSFDSNISDSAHNTVDEYTIGGNYYFKDNNLKLQTNLVGVDNHNGRTGFKVVVLTQYCF